MLQEKAFEPLRRAQGRRSIDQLHDDLARLESSVVKSMILSEPRLNELLYGARDVADAMDHTSAQDLHDLVKWHEARNVALNAQIVYRSALDRTESREQFYREDFPMTDPDWFCWHGVRSAGEDFVFDKQAFPQEGARFFPQKQESGLGPIGVIMSAQSQTTGAD